ncbi:exocyst complex component Sec3-domain-containing protein [Cristinia sonorae]|uniref:Exocyst complex component Sec3-domain-containing protein n=1 Tax=Cristinia sonorae TaxID=1940300 RepID=A0A8K0UM01_9AGAR|nr:exocyst complex component Sec3-domain-containing protein [Cristinia sonorae]
MADYESVKQRIISSVFSRRNATGGGEDETYVAHIKIYEDAGEDEGGRKPRYIIISQAGNRAGFIHKSKLNANGSFSVGKTWRLVELRGVEVVNPLSFNITLSRTYRWQTENQNDQINFVVAIIRLFRAITGGAIALQIAGIRDPDSALTTIPRQPPQLPQQTPNAYARPERASTPTGTAPLQPAPRRSNVTSNVQENSLPSRPTAYTRSESPIVASNRAPRPRPSSPATSRAESPDTVRPQERATTPSRTQRPTTPSSNPPFVDSQSPQRNGLPSSLRPRQGRRPSNASSTMRASSSTTTSQIPSIITTLSPQLPTSTTTPAMSGPFNGASNSPTESRSNGDSHPSSHLEPSPAPLTPSPVSAYQNYDTLDTPRPRARSKSPAVSPQARRTTVFNHDPSAQSRREPNARVSFYDPANQATLDRLLSGDATVQLTKDEKEEDGDGEEGGVEIENAQATLASVEEMLEGYEWASEDILSGKVMRGTADQIQARLLDELMALEKANIHSFIETDDRVNTVLKFLDDALAELDSMDSIVASYKIHLNVVNDDIAFIQSQNRGLQVQTQNQRALLTELEELLQTVQVDREALLTLTQESLEKSPSITRLEEAATQLYKALLAGRDRDMAATMERLDEYRTHNTQFCKRMFDFLSIMFTAQSKLLLGDDSGVIKSSSRGKPALKDHKEFESYLERYSGLMLYLKEMDEAVYGRLCAAYFSASSELHAIQTKAFMAVCNGMIKKVPDEDEGFGTAPQTGTYRAAAVGMKRAGTIVRSPLEGRKERKERPDREMHASDAFALILEQVAPMIYREEDFIADFLQINDAALTFADYMGLENYFRRQASRSAGLSSATAKLVRGALDLIFGFIPAELKTWLDSAIGKDTVQIVGIIVCLERFLADAEERGNAFLLNVLEKTHARLKSQFDRRINEHIKSVEDTKLTSKKRNGVAAFIKYFPTYIGKVESQLIGADGLEVRQHVDQSYDKLVSSMFEALKQMAKMDGEGEDKGQLNYHVILIENMHHFIAEISQIDIGTVSIFLSRAQAIYDENLGAYVKLVLRRPFAKIIDYFEGVERLLKTTAPSEISSNSTYSKTALKKVVKEFTAKDVRKNVDALFKRVEKHFTETTGSEQSSSSMASGTALAGVWKACEDELLRITELFSKRIAQCYQSSGVTLEYTAADVEGAFKRHRVAA